MVGCTAEMLHNYIGEEKAKDTGMRHAALASMRMNERGDAVVTRRRRLALCVAQSIGGGRNDVDDGTKQAASSGPR